MIIRDNPGLILPAEGIDKFKGFLIGLGRSSVKPAFTTDNLDVTGGVRLAQRWSGNVLELDVKRLGIAVIKLGRKVLGDLQGFTPPHNSQPLQILLIGQGNRLSQ